jgi:hypothetical protein
MGNSKICANNYYVEKFIMYTCLLGNPSCGKTPVMKPIISAISALESEEIANGNESRMRNPGTPEALLDLLHDLQSIITIYDESSAFIGNLGRYTGGKGDFDKSLILELFNDRSIYNRDLKSSKKKCTNPKLNMCLLGHPYTFINMIKDERQNVGADGLTQRFLFSSPKQEFDVSFEKMSTAPKPKVSLLS